MDIAEAARAVPDAFAMVSAADRINRGSHFIEKANGITEAASRRSRSAVAGIEDRDRDLGSFAAVLRCQECFNAAGIERQSFSVRELLERFRVGVRGAVHA